MAALQRSHLRFLVRARRVLRAAGELLAFIWAGASAVARVFVGKWPQPYKTPPESRAAASPVIVE